MNISNIHFSIVKMRTIKKGQFYKHFKGHTYIILEMAYDSDKYNEDNPLDSRMVVYQNVESKQIWVRPYDEFVSEVDHNKYPDVKQKYRFQKINNKKEEE